MCVCVFVCGDTIGLFLKLIKKIILKNKMYDNVLYILDDSKQYVETGGETTEYSSNGQVFSWKKLKKNCIRPPGHQLLRDQFPRLRGNSRNKFVLHVKC